MKSRFQLCMLLFIVACAPSQDVQSGAADLLRGKVIILDPGHGGTSETDHYRVGPTGEREEWINLRVSLMLRDLLEASGATVFLTREEDLEVPLADRGLLAIEHQADIFLSIHHNATADTSVNFPIVYYHGNASENQASVLLGEKLIRALRDAMFDEYTPTSLVSDHTIFPTRGTSVLRNSYGIPAVITEASFFTNPAEESRLKSESYNLIEAEALYNGIVSYLAEIETGRMSIKPYQETIRIEPFQVYQEADRMRPEALLWKQDVEEALILFNQFSDGSSSSELLDSIYELSDRSARSFPDSYLASTAHELRAVVYELRGEERSSLKTHDRLREFYPTHKSIRKHE